MEGVGGATLAWLGIAVAAAIVEVSLPHFGLAFVSAGALGAAGAAALSAGLPVQMGMFAVVLVASLAALRPWFLRRLGGRGVPSRTEPLIGKDGIVTHDIDSTAGAGRVN